ncbi:DcaP family trimeric outer membrane transporter [Marinomonas aquimarina]|nr:DcaP family trimeric outer membrane transporter [Marinomonas aquimarina]
MTKKVLAVSVLAGLGGLSQSALAFNIDAGDVQASVYGYAQLNAVYDINEDIGATTQAGQFSGLTDASNVAEGHFDADAQQSRIGISAQHKDGAKVVVEGDFRGGTFRIRHAYGAYGNWTVGRTWSNYNSWTGWTPTLDFDSTAGSPGVQDRVEQVRYSDGGLSFALEKDYWPNVNDGSSDWSGSTKSAAPSFTARYEGSAADGVNYVVAGVGRILTLDDGTTDESAVGFGAFTGVDVNMGAVTLHAVVNYSDGANAYLYRSGGNFGGTDAYLHNGDLETVSAWGGSIGLSTKIGDGDFNIVYGKVKMDLDDMSADLGNVGGNNESNTNAFVNYMWYPVDNVMMGVEVGYFKSDYYGGGDADATRVMYSAQYSF